MWGKTLAWGFVLTGALLAQDAQKFGQAFSDFQRFRNSKDPAERARAAEGLGEATIEKYDKQVADQLIQLLATELARAGTGKDEDKVSGQVLEACETALQKIRGKDAIDLLILQARRHANARLRFIVCRALGVQKQAVPVLIELVDDRDLRVQIGAVDGLVKSKDPAALDTFLKVLAGTDRTWESKWSALQGIEQLGDKSDKVVDAMIDILAKCKTDEGRIKVEIMRLLGLFLDIKEPKSDDPNWWKAARKDKDAANKEGQTAMEPTEFFGLKTKSTRIVFILDRTGSMEDPCTFPDPPKKDPPTGPAVDTNGKKVDPSEEAARGKAGDIKKKYDGRPVKSKMDGLKREFINTIYNLDPRVHFTVVWYAEKYQYWKEHLVPATWPNKLECIQDVEKLAPSGGTDIWGGLEAAYKMVEQPSKPDVVQVDKKGHYATIVNGPDTFFVMTDGNHNSGKFVKEDGGRPGVDTEGFLSELHKVHALRKVVVNAIALGDVGVGMDPLTGLSLTFLEKIAKETGGSFVHIGKQ
ncbi:MAG: HEAT repeat domain-containing protein [Planctomycetes bacterium]|nr:HEAT repeat domain-containing protein [Planctomycetota bacterium]